MLGVEMTWLFAHPIFLQQHMQPASRTFTSGGPLMQLFKGHDLYGGLSKYWRWGRHVWWVQYVVSRG